MTPDRPTASRWCSCTAAVEVLPEATHHTIPAEDADAVNAAMVRFLAR